MSWIKHYIKDHLMWLVIPIIVSLWLNLMVLSAYIGSIRTEQIIININLHGEMWLEILLLSISLILVLYSFIRLLRWRWMYYKAKEKLQ